MQETYEDERARACGFGLRARRLARSRPTRSWRSSTLCRCVAERERMLRRVGARHARRRPVGLRARRARTRRARLLLSICALAAAASRRRALLRLWCCGERRFRSPARPRWPRRRRCCLRPVALLRARVRKVMVPSTAQAALLHERRARVLTSRGALGRRSSSCSECCRRGCADRGRSRAGRARTVAVRGSAALLACCVPHGAGACRCRLRARSCGTRV